MKIKFKNLGPLESGEFELKDFTLFCGKNNTGKTYVNYLIYAILETLQNFKIDFKLDITSLLKEGSQVVDIMEIFDNNFDRVVKEISKSVKENLYTVFNCKKDIFQDFLLEINFNKDEKRKNLFKLHFNGHVTRGQEKIKIMDIIKEKNKKEFTFIYFENGLPEKTMKNLLEDYMDKFFSKRLIQEDNNKYMLPTERNGLNIFYNELLKNRADFVENIEINSEKKLELSSYSKPVKDYLEILTQLDVLDKKNTDDKNIIKIAEELEKEIIKGKYKIEKNKIIYQTENEKELDLYLASSTVKTIFGIIFYLRHLIKKGDYLIIDEPELNLHPENQIKIARLLARMAKNGVRVIISTHSDYISKELNNLLMLNNKFKGKEEIIERCGYNEQDILKPNKIRAYLFADKVMHEMEITDEGIITKTFDEVIESLNERNDEIYYSIKETGDVQ